MSFSDDYYAAKEKRKKKKKQEAVSQSKTKFEKQYYSLSAERDDDIAPVRTVSTSASKNSKTTKKEDDGKRKWFEKGLFEDGWQFGDVAKTVAGTILDGTSDLRAGTLGMGEKAVDAGAYVLGLLGNEQWKQKMADFQAKDLYDEEKISEKLADGSIIGHWLKKSGVEDIDDASVLGDKADSLLQSGGQLAGTVALQSVGVPWFVTSGVMSFGSATEEAFREGATYGEAGLSAAISAGAEVLAEKLFGGSGLGEKGLINLEPLTKGISSKVVKALADYGVDMFAEGAEEIVTQFTGNLGSALYKEDNLVDLLFSEEAIDGYIESAIGGAALGGVMNVGNVSNSIRTGRDYRTGLNDTEQTVIDKEVEKRIAEQEQDGTKLTDKQKDAIQQQVVSELDKGYISVDTIEEALGGDTYKTYQDTIANEDALRNEFDTLNKMKQGEMTGEQIDRRTELKQQLEELKTNSQRDQLKAQLSDEVFNLAKDTRLAESYNEKARRGQAYEADIAKYDAKQQKVIQKAIDSGILNNTNRTHEFVDMIAKISADKGVSFDFTDNARLKESGFAVDGANVNGYVNGNGDITLNIEADKSRRFVVGHEITHTLEGTELYTELQNTIFEYAKTKGEYDSRLSALTELYKNVEGADVNAELTADLVGDYLFTDADFINNLSTNHRNLFQKIYDEIKYLCKIATAGSKEARELEKVKKAFEDAYRAEAKSVGGTKYSLENGKKRKYNKRSKYSETESLFLQWENGSAPAGEVKRFVRYGKIRYFEKTVNGCVELSRSQYFERNGADGENTYRRAEREIGETNDYDGSTQRGMFGDSGGHRNAGGNVAVFGQTVREELRYDTARGTSSTLGHDNRNDINQSVLVEEAPDNSGASSFIPNNNDVQYSLTDNTGKQLSQDQAEYFKDSKVRDDNGNLKIMHHGSSETFTVFDKSKAKSSGTFGKGFYFTDSVSHANQYGNVYDVYLNITNPLQGGTHDISKEQLRKFVEYVAEDEDYGIDNYGYGSTVDSVTDSVFGKSDFEMLMDVNVSCVGDMAVAIELFNKANGTDYDGIITPMETVVFYPEQIKSVDNTKPTADPDIRYSLTEYTPEEKKAHNDMVRDHFGKTYMWAETGYLLLDGTKLDMSGKHEGAPGGYRTVDHRDIVDALGSDYGDGSYSGSLVQFMSEGNIRIIPEMGGINLSVQPTEAQEKALAGYVQMHRGEVVLDIDDANGYTVASVEYPMGTHSSKVLGDIRAYFENGTKPDYSLSSEGGKTKTYRYNGDVPMSDLRLAPVQDSVQDSVQDVAPVQEKPMADVDYAPITEDEANAQAAENLATIDEADAPPEVEAPYYGESRQERADDPFLHRDWDERTTKAFITDNPDAKPFFQEAAEKLAEDFAYTQPAERGFNAEQYYNTNGEKGFYGWSRKAADDINTLMDVYGLSYAQIADGLDAIIHDTPKVNNKPAKTIEFILNDRMLKGTKMWCSGEEIPPHQGYIDWLNGQKHADEFGESFAAITDADAPMDIAPVAESLTAPDVMPIAENIAPMPKTAQRYEAIRPKAEKEPRMARATPAEQARAEIMTEEPPTGKKKGEWRSKIKNGVIDKGMVFEDLSLKTGNRELQARWNSIRYAESKAQRLMGEGDASVKSLNSIREAVEKTGKTKQFYEYLYHQHNADRMTLAERFPDMENKPVFGDGVTARESKAIIAELNRKHPEFKQYAQDVYDYNTHLRELLVEGGVISRETADLWEKMYPHYVPIRRLGDDGLNINVPLDTGRTGVNAPIKRATGGNRDILPLFDTMGQRTVQTYKAIAKNRFGVELKNTLGTTIESDAVGVDDAIDSIDTQDGLLQEGKNGRKPTFTVFENGEKVTFEITDEMYDAMKPTNDTLAKTIKPLNAVSNFRRATLTEYNPWFMLKNAVKDVQDVLINSQHATKTYLSIPKAIAQMKSKGHWYQEYVANGGEQNTYFDHDTNTFKEENAAWETIKKMTGLSAIQKANNVIEMLPRLAEYIASREAGRSVDVSMLDAARVTTNFAAGGDLTKFFNRNGATFLNASVQGAAQQVRNFREAKAEGLKGWAKLAGKFVLAGLPALLLNGIIWDDDEEYEELSDYVKQNYYIVGKYGDGQFVRIPKGRTVAVIQNAFEQMQNAITGDDEVDLKTFTELVVGNLAPNNPLDNNIFSPIAQVAQNKTWYGEDLVPTRLQDVPAAEQYDESTDSISRWLGEATNTSPYKWNYLLDQYSGVIGDTFLPMLTPEAESGDNSFAGNMIAPLKDMFTTDSVMNNQNVSDFYDTVDKLAVNANGSKATDEDVLKYKYMNSINADMGDLYKRKREVQNSDLPDDEKYSQVRRIQAQIDRMAETALNSYDSVTISGEYATVGDRHYRWYEPGEDSDAEPGWQKISGKQLEKQKNVTSKLGITPDEYWGNKEEYDYAYDNPEKYAIAKAVGGYTAYRGYSSELYDITADKDKNGKSISGSRKEKVIDYINELDADYGERIILFKSQYTADDTYNRDIVEYLDSRDDISWEEMKTILEELDFTVYDDGRITW